MLITYYSNSQKFLYDFQHIIRAFYPDAQVKFGYGGDVHFEANFDGLKVFLELQKENKTLTRDFLLCDDEHESKRIFGRNLYEILSDESKRQLAWGILTGIRPTKIAFPLLEKGLKDEDILKYLQEEYYISGKKSKLLLEVAKKEIKILGRVESNSACLYIGIPICPTKCLYCSFSCNELTRQVKSVLNVYTDALLTELERTYRKIKENKNNIVAVYFGGGSPAVLGIKNLRRVFSSILNNLEKEYIQEITFEAGRPDTIDDNLLQMLSEYKRDYNNIRLCINPQTSNDNTLKIIGRNHTFKDIKKAFSLAKEYGFENINSDVILGLPGEDEKDFVSTIKDVLELYPASITVHTLSIKRASLLRFKWNEYKFMEEKQVNNLLDWAQLTLQKEGYLPYYMYRQKNMIGNFENVGYSKEGFEGLYNVMIMQEKHNIYACGAKAVSKFVYEGDRIERVFNPADVNIYISRMLE